MPPKKKIRIPEGQQTLFQLIRQPSNHCDCENQNDRGESESPADRDSSQMEEENTQTESETTTSAAASTKSKVQSENVLQESEKTLQSESKMPSDKIIAGWKKEHKWLTIQNGAMFCSLCKNANLKNKFTTSGSTNWKTSALNERIAGTGPNAHKHNNIITMSVVSTG